MSEPRKFKKETLQMKFVEETSHEDGSSDSEEDEPNKIEVRNVPDKVDEKLLKVYFEGVKSGGCEGAVAECERIQQGVFIVTFHDPKGKKACTTLIKHRFMLHLFTAVAAQVMSRESHTFKKGILQLEFVRQVKQKAEEEFKMNQLAIHGLPDGVDKEIYEVVIAGCLDMDEEDDFELQINRSSAVITFTKPFTHEGTCTC